MNNENAPIDNKTLSISIGAVSSACGIPISTIRTWERRYGFPSPDRTPGNQRLYNPNVIEQLKLIQLALDHGHRPGQVVPLTMEKLQNIVGKSSTTPKAPVNNQIQRWIEAARQLDGSFLEAAFQQSSKRLGIERFLVERVSPFLYAIGEAWTMGKLQIFHEHFASERLHDFLTSIWRPLSNHSSGPYVICATLPGEKHYLGLHMATTIAALHGYQILFLGPKTPLEEITSCAAQVNASAVLISVSVTSEVRRSDKMLRDLLSLLPRHIDIVVGGGGMRTPIPGIKAFNGLDKFSQWAEDKKLTVD